MRARGRARARCPTARDERQHDALERAEREANRQQLEAVVERAEVPVAEREPEILERGRVAVERRRREEVDDLCETGAWPSGKPGSFVIASPASMSSHPPG